MGSKKAILSVGFLVLLLVIFEFVLAIRQPLTNLGFTFEPKPSYYKVTGVVKNSLASHIMNKGDHLYSIDNLTPASFYNLRQSTTEQGFKKLCSDFFAFGKSFQIEQGNGDRYTMVVNRLRFWQSIANLSFFFKLKFAISLILILYGICLELFYKSNNTTFPLIYSLFFMGLTTANIFDSLFSSPLYSNVVTVFMDIGLFCSFACIFGYFSKIFEYAHYKNIFKYLKFVPLIIIVFKYIHILIGKMDLIDNTFFPLYSHFVEGCFLIFFILFVYIICAFPKSLTISFKFFVLGVSLAVTPLFVDHLGFLISKSLIMTEESKIFSVISFIFIPILLTIALLQNLSIIRSKIATIITSHIAFPVIIMPCYFTIRDFLPYNYKDVMSAVSLMLAPVVFTLLYRLILKFFSMDTSNNNKQIENYRLRIEHISNLDDLHKITAEYITELTDCSYIFSFKKLTNNSWEEGLTYGTISDDERKQKAVESINKKRIVYYKDGSFSIPLFRDLTTTGVFHFGTKANEDPYLPGEHYIIEQILKVFHKHYLSITNTRLVEEINQKNKELQKKYTELQEKINEIQNMNKKVQKMQLNIIISMANLIESRDGGTGEHVKRTGAYSALLARVAKKKGLFKDQIDDNFIACIYKAAALHDVGKIIVSDTLLKKPGKFTDEEYEQMKRHSSEGGRIVKEMFGKYEDSELITMTSNIATYHHEKWNGQGYPIGLHGNSIPLCARIVTIADAFDAIVSPRCYKSERTPEEGFEIIRKDAGSHFDPVLAELFIEAKDQILEILKITE